LLLVCIGGIDVRSEIPLFNYGCLSSRHDFDVSRDVTVSGYFAKPRIVKVKSTLEQATKAQRGVGV
jgi:hypothetical protein